MAENTVKQNEQSKTIPWPDFSKSLLLNRFEIRMFCLSRGRRYLILQNGDRDPSTAKALGFKRSASGIWLRPEGTISTKMFREWQSIVPELGIKRVTHEDAVVGESLLRSQTQDLVSKSTLLGYNRVGQQVFASSDNDRRFTKNPRGWKVMWEEEAGKQGEQDFAPDMFLRSEPGDHGSIIRCAEGALFSLSSGHIQDISGIADFAGTAGLSVEALSAGISDAITRSFASNVGLARDAFEVARDLEERLSFPTGSLPAPLKVALTRLLGNDNELKNAKVSFSADIGDLGVALRIPRTAELKARISSEEEAARAGAIARGNHSAIRLETHDDPIAFHEGSDVIVHKMTSLDLEEVATLHDYRAVDGRSVLIIDQEPEPSEEDVRKFLREIGRTLHLENAAIVSGSYITKEIGGKSQVIVALGPRRSLPLAADEVELPASLDVNDSKEAWRFGVDAMQMRRVAEETARIRTEKAKKDSTAENAEAGQNVDLDQDYDADGEGGFQVPYVSACRELGEPEALIPRHLDGASRRALEGLVRRRGNIVEFLCSELNWTKDQLAANLSPEQADGVALWIDARLTRKPSENSVIIADGTGTGKGRQLATTLIWSALRGEKSIFLTENVKLLNDIWNDIREMGMEHLFNPMVTNQTKNSVIVDLGTNEPIFPPLDAHTLNEIYQSGRIPEEVNLILGSYTQLAKDDKVSPRVAWFKSIAPDCHLATDEAHVAAGKGITARNVQHLIQLAAHHTPASGTWAKDIKAIPFYTRAIPDYLPAKQLVPIFQKGGVTAQEAFTSMMVNNGRMVRREMGLNNVELSTVADAEIGLSHSAESALSVSPYSEQRRARNRDLSAAVSSSLAEIARFSGQVRKHVEARDAEVARRARSRKKRDLNKDEVSALRGTMVGIGSPLHTFSRTFEAALVADLAVEQGLKALEAGEKPLFVSDLTGENYMRQILDDDKNHAPTIKDALVRMLTLSSHYRRDHQTRVAIEENDELRAEFERVKEVIAELPDFPLLATDIVKNEFRQRNVPTSEISGRKYEVVDGLIVDRKDLQPSEAISAFQNGDLEAMILGKPAFTGVSLHSAEKAADQRKRSMFMVLPPQDILQLFQVIGRVSRRKQVMPSSVTWLSSGLPASLKLSMYIERHMQRLSANTTSNRENAVSRGDLIPDIFNSVGHEVCFRFLENNPVLAERMGLAELVRQSMEDDDGVGSLETTWANKLMTYLLLLHPDEQDRVMTEVFEEYEQVIEELNARNENPLKTKALLGTCTIVEKNIFDGVEDADSEREPVYLTEINHTQDIHPMRSEELLTLIDNAEADISRAQMSDTPIFRGRSSRSCVRNTSEVANALRVNERQILEEALQRHNAKNPGASFDTVEAAFAINTDNHVKKASSRLERLASLLPQLRPGTSIWNFDVSSFEATEGVITDIACPTDGNEMKLGHYRISVVWPGEEKPTQLSLSYLLSKPELQVGRGLHGQNRDLIIEAFDAAEEGAVSQKRFFLTGNILEALRISTSMEKPLGQISTFTDENGVVHRGLLIKEASKELKLLPVSIAEPDVAAAMIMRPGGTDLYSTSKLQRTRGVLVLRGGLGEDNAPETFIVRYPTLKGTDSEVYESPSLRRRVENIGTKKGRPQIEVTAYELPEILKELTDAGVTFFAPPSAREITNEIAAERSQINKEMEKRELHSVVVNFEKTENGNDEKPDNKPVDGVGFDDDAVNMLIG